MQGPQMGSARSHSDVNAPEDMVCAQSCGWELEDVGKL